VVRRLDDQAGLPVPTARAIVEKWHDVGLRSRQLVLEKVREERVVAVPLALRVERDQKQVRALELLEDLCGAGAVRDGVAERPAQPSEDRRVEEERAELRGLTGEQLPRQVVDQISVVAGKCVDHAARVGFAAKRQRGQVERGRPSLRPRLQPLDVRPGQIELEHAVEKRRRILVAEAKLTGTQLGELAAGAQSTERQRWILTARNDDVKRLREALDQVGKPLVDLRVRDQVVVVENEDERPLETRYVVQEEGEHDIDESYTGGLLRRQRPRPDLRLDRAQGRDHVRKETRRVVVVVVE
jgi:hypothetical protein